MPISFACPNCQRTGRLPDGYTGSKIKCPACQTISEVTIPLTPEPEAPPRPPRRPVVQEKPAVRASASRDEWDEVGDDEPERSGIPVPLLMASGVGVAVFAVLIGVVLVVLGKPGQKPVAPAAAQAPAPPAASEPSTPAAPVPAIVNTKSVAPAVPRADAPAPNPGGKLADIAAPTPAPASSTPAPTPAPPNESLAETVRRIKDAAVLIKVRAGQTMGSGSGFVIRVDGDQLLVATNHHVISPHIEGAEEDAPPSAAAVRPVVTAVFRSGQGTALEQSVPATIIATDREGNRDLAILRVAGVKNPPRPIDLTQEVALTETMPVLIYGFPFGNIDKMLNAGAQGNPAITINKGSVSSLRLNEFNKVAYVQIDGSINPGNSGGPVVDEHGRLVGVSVAQISHTTIGFAVPTHELTRMLDGRLGRLSLAFQSERAGKASLQVQAKVIDPLRRIRSVSFHYVPLVGAPVPPRPNADGTWPALTGATRVNLAVNGPVASGLFQAPIGGAGGRKMLVQASYVDSRGRTLYTNAVPYEVPAQPTALAALGAAPASPGSGNSAPGLNLKPTFNVLGPMTDSTRNCKLSRNDSSLTIDIPAGIHLLSPELDVKNSPMVLTDVEGDFLAQVRVGGTMLPGSEPARHRGKALPFTFQGAGVLLWQDKNNYLRLERTVGTGASRLTVVNRVLLEACKNGKPAGHIYLDIPEGPLHVRIARIDGALQCMFGPDGRKWVAFKKLAIAFPAKVRVGLAASNASKELLSARFEEFTLVTDLKKLIQGETNPP